MQARVPAAYVQALQYLRRLCSHPLLALDPSNAAHVAAATRATHTDTWAKAQAQLHALQHAPKLAALRDLLHQCGIGRAAEEGIKQEPDLGAGEGELAHRVLVFAQLRAVLDLVEQDVLAPMGVPFVRLDGGSEPLWVLQLYCVGRQMLPGFVQSASCCSVPESAGAAPHDCSKRLIAAAAWL